MRLRAGYCCHKLGLARGASLCFFAVPGLYTIVCAFAVCTDACLQETKEQMLTEVFGGGRPLCPQRNWLRVKQYIEADGKGGALSFQVCDCLPSIFTHVLCRQIHDVPHLHCVYRTHTVCDIKSIHFLLSTLTDSCMLGS